MSAFDIIGPPMIGPSSSHTAGAARIGLLARYLLGAVPESAVIGLHGSFAATGTGHATDRALAGGLLGFSPDDERIATALDLAAAGGMEILFSSIDLGDSVHPNSTRLELSGACSRHLELVASSVGGGSIETLSIDGFSVRLCGQLDTLVLWHEDRPGFLSHVTAIFAAVEANIATIRTARRHRAAEALTAVELDAPVLPEISGLLSRMSSILHQACIPPLP